MHYSLEMLVQGKDEVVEYYRTASARWHEIWSRPESRELASFAKLIQAEQFWFEEHCGGRWTGQEVMIVAGLAGLYTTANGFDRDLPRARLLYDAILTSYCSIELKMVAEEVARSYDLLAVSQS